MPANTRVIPTEKLYDCQMLISNALVELNTFEATWLADEVPSAGRELERIREKFRAAMYLLR